ncbi:MAG: hypothetical protein HZB86_00415 [Deltaproteobacteria bacterium]|nr:hypothetical protein [Deltaproteobacteria bacterium]
MTEDGTRAGWAGEPVPERDIVDGFDRLIAANRLFGAELNPSVLKKSGKGSPFLIRKPPPAPSSRTAFPRRSSSASCPPRPRGSRTPKGFCCSEAAGCSTIARSLAGRKRSGT